MNKEERALMDIMGLAAFLIGCASVENTPLISVGWFIMAGVSQIAQYDLRRYAYRVRHVIRALAKKDITDNEIKKEES